MKSRRTRPAAPPKRVVLPEPVTPAWQIYAAGAAILLLYVALRLPGIGIPLDRDEGAFGYIGQMIHRGALPYRDAADHKPPVAFFLYAFALHFFPATETGVHIFLLLYNAATLGCIFALARIYFGSLGAALWCAFAYALFSASPAIQGFTASTEMFALLPVSASLLCALLAFKKKNPALILLSGLAGAMACWTKQTAFTSVLFIFLLVVFAPDSRERRSRHGALWLAGASAFSAVLMLYFFARGGLPDLVYWCFTYDISYVGVPFSRTLELLKVSLSKIMAGDFLLVLAGFFAVIWSAFRDKSRAYFLGGFLGLSFLGTLPGYAYPHYFAQLAPAVALAAGFGLWLLVRQFRSGRGRLLAAAACGAIAVALPLAANDQYFLERNPDAFSRYYFGANPFPESKMVAGYIEEKTQPSDGVFILGSEPQILFYAQRRSPSSFVMLYPLMKVHPRYQEFQRQMLAELQRNPPKYIIGMMHMPSSFGWDGAADTAFMGSLNMILTRDYTLERVRLVAGPEGEWVDLGSAKLSPDAPLIYIFKRKT